MPNLLCCAGRAMADGAGVLADGTAWERTSGEERGKNGFWLRWTSLRGVSSSGKVQLITVTESVEGRLLLWRVGFLSRAQLQALEACPELLF